ncbi:hypothetical protein K491DRAFT_606029 [Lophiostoma macrostomum CBS 122681]|uniref:Zn(2)-C6 fungal-type domain-containing protein n=1 Tax=Lophiostoma macrostomum CBS 122681 TaxID=1314788 RepID=A0A6A6SXU0_9PLEO|nr:hypothetical protein K491DRAFT_606029 [Lophiostoma macrostomum CBS 122681]
MVYRGKPSAACHLCRSRRIKCDLKRPSCTQCTNRYLVCPGYRTLVDLYFKSENESVARKVQRHTEPPAYVIPASTPQGRVDVTKEVAALFPSRTNDIHRTYDIDTFSEHLGTSVSPFLCLGLPQPVEDIGLAYFMSFYVPGSHFEYLPSLYNDADTSSPLPAVLHAASLASLSHETGDPSLMELARKSYVKGLTSTNTALSNATTAVQDSTLASILLLSLFEALVWDGIYTAINWTAHTMGAMALLKLRGEAQFRTEIGRRMFSQVGNNVRVSCIQRQVRSPPELLELLSIAEPYFEGFNPKFMLAHLATELTELLDRGRRAQGRMPPLEIVRATRQLDVKFMHAMKRLPPEWQYRETQSQDETSISFQGTMHQYPSHHVAQFWNSYRMIRVLLNGIVYHVARCEIERTSLPDIEFLEAEQKAIVNITAMAEGICASVQHFMPTSLSATNSSVDFCNTNLPSRACAASLLWPLSAVRSSSTVPKATAQYASDRLRELGFGLKIRQAVEISQIGHEFDALKDGLVNFSLFRS